MKKFILLSKVILILSCLSMALCLGLVVVFDVDYDIPLLIAQISGIFFILSDIVVALNAIIQVSKKNE